MMTMSYLHYRKLSCCHSGNDNEKKERKRLICKLHACYSLSWSHTYSKWLSIEENKNDEGLEDKEYFLDIYLVLMRLLVLHQWWFVELFKWQEVGVIKIDMNYFSHLSNDKKWSQSYSLIMIANKLLYKKNWILICLSIRLDLIVSLYLDFFLFSIRTVSIRLSNRSRERVDSLMPSSWYQLTELQSHLIQE
jgi:hypothetical protein